MTSTAPAESRANNIDAIRLLLALLVLFSHSFQLGTGSYASEPLAWLTGGQATLGGIAVDGFFILSGFLITQSWDRSRGARSFLEKRVRRIYPAFVVATAFDLWVVAPLTGGEGAFSGRMVARFFRSSALLGMIVVPGAPSGVPIPGALNASLWTIRYEFGCYLGVLALGLTGLIHRRRLVLGLFLATCVVGALARLPGFEWIARSTRSGDLPRFVPLFLAGMVAYLYRDRLNLVSRPAALASLAGLAAASLVPTAMPSLVPLLGACLLLYLAFTTDWRWHGAARHGDFSYGIYLFSFPIQQLIMHAAGRPLPALALFALALPPVLLAAFLSWNLVESRFLRRPTTRAVPAPAEGPKATPAESLALGGN